MECERTGAVSIAALLEAWKGPKWKGRLEKGRQREEIG